LIFSCGYLDIKEGINRWLRYGASVGMMPIRTSPVMSLLVSLAEFSKSLIWNKTVFAFSIMVIPTSVGTTGCLLRSKIMMLSSSSNFLIIILNVAGVTKQDSAAR